MSPNVYLFSVVAAAIGMTTVFIGLTLLSLMMVFLRRLFRAQGEPTQGIAPQPIKITIRPAQRDTRWVIAAVALFLTEEAKQSERSAERWRPRVDERHDPWMVQPRV